MPNEIPSEYGDADDVGLLDDPNDGGTSGYEDLLAGQDLPRADPNATPDPKADPVASVPPVTPPATEPPAAGAPPVTPPATQGESTRGDSWEPSPVANPNWQAQAQQQNIQVSSEAEYREELETRQYVNSRYSEDAEAQQLNGLLNEKTPPEYRIRTFVTNDLRAKRPYQSVDSQKFKDALAGEMTDYIDDEGELTEEGKSLDEYLKSEYSKELNRRVGVWAQEGTASRKADGEFQKALQSNLSGAAGLTEQQAKDAYSYGQTVLPNLMKGLDAKGAKLSPAELGAARGEVAKWANPVTRKILVDAIIAESKKSGESELLKKLSA